VIEKAILGKPPLERQIALTSRATPLLASLHDGLQETLRSLSRKSALADAIRYALKLWPALIRYTSNGLVEMDNNTAERALRTVALGRKNFLFAGSDAGGERAAAIYSLIGSAKLNGVGRTLTKITLNTVPTRPAITSLAFIVIRRQVHALTVPSNCA
jgi:hypothetical protein